MTSTVWRGQLTFGLVSFPVRLYTAARKERVGLHHLQRTSSKIAPIEEPRLTGPYGPSLERSRAGAHLLQEHSERGRNVTTPLRPNQSEVQPLPVTRVKQELISEAYEQPVSRQELLKGYEIAPEQYVTFGNEELRRLRQPTSPEMQILQSVRLADIDPIYFETSYYVVPDRGGERAYALLFAALQETSYVALAKVAMHGREHIMAVRPGHKGLIAHTMYYNDEIRTENEFKTSISEVARAELDLAKTFVEAISGQFAPEEFKDSYREQVKNLISSKVARKEIAVSAPAPQPVTAPVLNIFDALKRSLELARKPAKTEVHVSRRAPRHATELKSKA